MQKYNNRLQADHAHVQPVHQGARMRLLMPRETVMPESHPQERTKESEPLSTAATHHDTSRRTGQLVL